MVKHTEDPVRARRAAASHRRLSRALPRQRRPRRSRPSARRCAKTRRTSITLGHLERLADATRAWEELAALYEAELGKLLEVPRQVEMLLRVARVYEEELGADRQGDRHLPPRRRRRGREPRRDPGARSAVPAAGALARAGRDPAPRDPAGAGRRGDRRAAVPARTAATSRTCSDVDNAIEVYREILTADPGHGPTLAALELLFAEGVKQIEIAGILEPLYRVAEQWEKLVKIHEVQLEKLTGADERTADDPAHRRDPRAQARRSAVGVRLVGAGGARGADERAGRRRGRAAGAGVPHLGRAGRRLHARCSRSAARPETQRHVLPASWRASTKTSCATRAAPRSRTCACWRSTPTRRRGAGGARSHLRQRRRCGASWPTSCAAASASPPPPTRSSSSTSGSGASTPMRSTNSAEAVAALQRDPRDRLAQRRALEALGAGLLPATRRGQELFGVYEKMVDIAPGDEGMAECYARMAKIAVGRARRAREGGRPVGSRHRSARRGSDRARRARRSVRARASSGASWSTSSSAPSRITHDPQSRSRSTSASAASGARSSAASATRSRRGRRSSRSIRPTSRRCARWRRSTSRRRRGKSWSRRCTS